MTERRGEGRSILVIDDDHEDFELVQEAAKEVDSDMNVYFLERCEDAPKFRRQKFDFILLDINMPQEDGFCWLKGIRDRGFTDVPIVMYTNSLSPNHIARAYEEGANLYFSKPETFSNLVRGIQDLLNMDWSNPHSITKKYSHEGKYRILQYD